MQKHNDIQETVIRIIADHLGLPAASLDVNAHILDDLGGDSLDHVELIITIEERFGINIRDEDRPAMLRISDVIGYIKRNSHAS